jgi:hypothetical protein
LRIAETPPRAFDMGAYIRPQFTCNAWGQLQLLLRLAASLVSEQGEANEPGVYWAVCTEMIVPAGHVSAKDWVSQPTLWYVLSVPVNNATEQKKKKKNKTSNYLYLFGNYYNQFFFFLRYESAVTAAIRNNDIRGWK